MWPHHHHLRLPRQKCLLSHHRLLNQGKWLPPKRLRPRQLIPQSYPRRHRRLHHLRQRSIKKIIKKQVLYNEL